MSYLYCLLLVLALMAAAAAQGTAPGGRFEARVKAAERKLRRPARKPVRRAPRRAAQAPRNPSPIVSRPSRPKRVTRAAPRRARPRPMARAPAPVPVSRGWVSYSVDPRADHPSSPLLTGDLVLFAEPQGVPVRFTWDGGRRVIRNTLVLKGQLPRDIRVTADAPSLRGTATAWVPVKAGCITTVRIGFPRRGEGLAASR